MTRQESTLGPYESHTTRTDTGDKDADAPRQQRNLSVQVGVRFTADEAEHIRRLAQARGISVADFVREAIKAYTEVVAEPGPVGPIVGSNLTLDYGTWMSLDVLRPIIELSPDFRRGLQPSVP